MPDAKTPAWYAKPFTLSFPVGIIAVVVTALVSAGAAGGVGIAIRDGDLSAVDKKIEAAAEQLRREAEVAHRAEQALAATRYEELLRRLDRIERQLDGTGR